MKHIATGKRGFALLIVLGFLVLIMTLVIAMLIGATSNYSASKTYANGATSKQLADTAVNLVIGSIRQATTLGPNFAWASQPGMIRTYGTVTGPSGDPYEYYKLYSSDTMVENGTAGAGNPLSSYDPSVDVATTWDKTTALFSDLNSPVTLSNGDLEFPILDPRAYTSTTSTPTTASTATSVPGFTYGGGSVDLVQLATTAGTASNSQRLPMPVKWIYVLQDGTLTVPTGGSGSQATWSGSKSPPSSANPIVGRIAYWTDDETSKININTAGGDFPLSPTFAETAANTTAGSYWDIPHVNSAFDLNLGLSQPCQYEFQRYPGHPSTVCLSEAFPPSYTPTTRPQIIALTPRLSTNPGSAGGTVPVAGSVTVPTLSLSFNRLYATADEFLFGAPTRTQNQTTYSGNTSYPIPPSLVEQEKFFITAHSRAPDLNLFGQPRVCIWPISSTNDANHRTGTDNLIAFCSTVGPASAGTSYYFQRANSNDQAYDYWDIPRNQALYQYLQNLTSQPIPGFSASSTGKTTFSAKYTPLERDQILTEIFDYIRCVNLYDAILSNQTGGVTYTPPPALVTSKIHIGLGQVIPIQIATSNCTSANPTTMGFGRMDTIYEAALDVFATQGTAGSPTAIRAVLLLAPFSPSQGNCDLNPNYTVRISSTPPSYTPGVAGNYPPTSSTATTNVTSGLTITGTIPASGRGGHASTSVNPVFFWGSDNLVACPVLTGELFWGGVAGLTSTFDMVSGSYSGPQGLYSCGPKTIPPSNTPQGVATGRLPFATSFTTSGAFDAFTCYPFISQEINGGAVGSTTNIAAWTNFSISGTIYVSIYANNGSFDNNGSATVGGESGGASIKAPDPFPGTPGQLIQTIPFTFTQSNLPLPFVPIDPTVGGPALTSAMDFSYRLAGSLISTSGPTYGGIYGGTAPGNYATTYLLEDNFIGAGPVGSPSGSSQYDVVQGLESYGVGGDIRLVAANLGPTSSNPGALSSAFSAHPYPGSNPTGNSYQAYSMRTSENASPNNGGYPGADTTGGTTGWALAPVNYGALGGLGTVNDGVPPLFPPYSNSGSLAGALLTNSSGGTQLGDWDTGMGGYPDGPYISKSDDGTTNESSNLGGQWANGGNIPPYFGDAAGLPASLASPNRIIASPVAFGSLSTGVIRGLPWQTLLFRPDPTGLHPGTVTPKDYLLLDLFTMPVVQPYAISEPLSTAGRINMNYRIAPFTNIKRETAVLAALQSTMVMSIPNASVMTYKNLEAAATTTNNSYIFRYPINGNDSAPPAGQIAGTLSFFDNRFNLTDTNAPKNPGLFISPAEICDIPMVPQDGVTTPANMTANTTSNYWTGASATTPHQLTGDNVREMPYNHLYPLLTTQSNTYTVHYRVQVLKKSSATTANLWDDSQDQVVSEYRGSTTLDRYIDPQDPRLTPGNTGYIDPDTSSLEPLYQYRIVSTRRFSP